MNPNQFPVFRKTLNEKSYYRINSPTRFIEIQLIGSQGLIHEVEAKIFPEKMFIADLIANQNGSWLAINEEEFTIIYQRLTKEKLG